MAKYDKEFKKQIAELVYSKIKTKAEIKREYDISRSTVIGWEKEFYGTLKSKEILRPQEEKKIRLKKLLK